MACNFTEEWPLGGEVQTTTFPLPPPDDRETMFPESILIPQTFPCRRCKRDTVNTTREERE